MASVYTNDLRLEEIGSGEQSGSWGDTTNTNLELIAEAFAFGTEAITTNADTHATTIADGATDPGRAMFLKYTGTLDSPCTITLGPNTVSKLWFIENGTSGSENIIIKQGSGATVTIPPGDTKAIYSNGAGSGGAMVDAFASLSVVDLKVQDDLTVTDDLVVGGDIDLEGSIDVNGTTNLDIVDIDGAVNMATTALVTGVLTTTAATVFNGGFASNADSTMGTNKKLIFRDSDIHISSVNDGDLMIAANDEIDITSALIDINGAVDMSSTLKASGHVAFNGAALLGQSGISEAALNFDSGGNYGLEIKDVGSGTTGTFQAFYRDTAVVGTFANNSGNFLIGSSTSDKDLLFQGNDGGTPITALTLDMSEAGAATFNSNVLLPDNRAFVMGASSDFQIYHESSVNIIQAVTSNQDIVFKGVDGGSAITALTLDMGEGGDATFSRNLKAVNSVGVNGADGMPVLQQAAGSVSFPSYSFYGDGNTGMYRIGSDVLGFGTAGAERVRISASGIAFHGDTATANALNDYEEGTFTPVYVATGTAFGAITHDTQSGYYTRIGNVVNFSLVLRTDAFTLGSGSGSVQINGLPFSVAGTNTVPVAINAQAAWTNYMPFGGWVSSTVITLTNNAGGSDRTGYRTIPVANMTDGLDKNRIYLTGTYMTS